MALDDELLLRAKALLKAVDDAEAALVAARLRSRAAVRELHRSGASLREIAAALGLSHQRVHQLVAPESTAPAPAFGCAFCGATQEQRRRIVMGPNGSGICERCTDHASELLEAWQAAPGEPRRRQDPAMAVLLADVSCHFCGKKAPPHVPAQVVGLSGAAVCGECLVLAHKICTDDLPDGS